MSNGKNQFDSGRARNARCRDRAQLEFEDMLIDDFYDEKEPPAEVDRTPIPVRYGSDQLAAFMDDSTIAAALIRGDTFEADEQADPLTVGEFPEPDLFDLASHEQSAEVQVVQKAPQVVKPIRPARTATSVVPESDSQRPGEFTWRGLAVGFTMGAVAAVCALTALQWIM